MNIATGSFIFRFADVEVHEREYALVKAGESLTVEPKAFRVLLILLHNPQKLIPKEELLNSVWGDAAVTENSLTRSIALLRNLLGDDAHSPRFIETVATVGYRFVCPVEGADESPVKVDAQPQSPATNDWRHRIDVRPLTKPTVPVAERSTPIQRWAAVVASTLLLISVAGGIWYLRLPLPPRITGYHQLTHDGVYKRLFGTDGARLYFNELYPQKIVQLPISEGQPTPIPIDMDRFEIPSLWGEALSPDGSNLLVYNPGKGLFVVGVLGHPVRYLADGLTGAWPPNGKEVAFSTERGEIFEIPVEGGEARLLAALTEPSGNYSFISDLSWSPDGKRIRFTREHALWEICADGSNLHPVLSGWNRALWKCCGRWTPDGEFFLFITGEANSSPYFPGNQLWAIDERRGGMQPANPELLDSGPLRWGTPIPAPDGHTIFAWGATLRGQLVRYDRKSDELQPFLNGISAEYVTFSTDRKSVAYVSFPEGILWVANRDGTEPVQLTSPPMYPRRIRWSPDGKQILFTDLGPGGVEALYVISAQGGSATLLLPEEKGPQSDGFWSPDGSQVVFSSFDSSRPRGHVGKAELRILNLRTHAVTVLPGSEGMQYPRWSPDGRSIAGSTRDAMVLRIFDVQARRWSTYNDARVAVNPNWSHDGRFVYFVDILHDPIRVSRLSVSNGRVESVADLKYFHPTGWYRVWLGLDPDDNPLLLRDAGSHEIYALTLQRK